MTHTCLNCGRAAETRFRLVLGSRRMERLCQECSHHLSTLVRTAGDTCQLTMANPRFRTWLETGRWPMQDGRTIGLHDPPAGEPPGEALSRLRVECPCCAPFAEEDD